MNEYLVRSLLPESDTTLSTPLHDSLPHSVHSIRVITVSMLNTWSGGMVGKGSNSFHTNLH